MTETLKGCTHQRVRSVEKVSDRNLVPVLEGPWRFHLLLLLSAFTSSSIYYPPINEAKITAAASCSTGQTWTEKKRAEAGDGLTEGQRDSRGVRAELLGLIFFKRSE